jgi:hypothetical protein
MEVLPEHVRVLADRAEWAEEIDVKRAQLARQRSTDMLQRHGNVVPVPHRCWGLLSSLPPARIPSPRIPCRVVTA